MLAMHSDEKLHVAQSDPYWNGDVINGWSSDFVCQKWAHQKIWASLFSKSSNNYQKEREAPDDNESEEIDRELVVDIATHTGKTI